MLRDDLYGFAKNQMKKKAETKKKENNIPKNCDKKKAIKLKAVSRVTKEPLPRSINRDLDKVTECDNIQPSCSGIKISQEIFMEAECDMVPSCSGIKNSSCFEKKISENKSEVIDPKSLFIRSKRTIKPRKIFDL